MCRKLLITLGILYLLSGAQAKADDFAYTSCPLGEGYVFLYDTPTGFQVVANLKCGQKVAILDARDRDRLHVRAADGKEGYVLRTSMTAPVSDPSTAITPKPASQQPQVQPQPEQPKSQPSTEPQADAQRQATASIPLVSTQTQPASQRQASPQPQPSSDAKPMPAPAMPEPEVQAERKPQEQLEGDVKSEAASQLDVKAQPEPEPLPEVKAKSEPQPESAVGGQPRDQAQPQQEAELQSQPQQPAPAATAFVPFSTLGYDRNIPRMEFSVGYSFLNVGTSGLTSRQNVSGFEGSVAIHANRWLAAEANMGGYYKTLNILGVGTFPFHSYLAMGGPRFNFRKAFVHALVGVDRLTGSTNFYAAGATTSNTVLAGAAGGGVQWNVSPHLALRTSADYVLSRFGGLNQNNIRVSVGLVFEAGSVRAE